MENPPAYGAIADFTQFRVRDEEPDYRKKYFTQLPNCLFNLGLSPFEIALYAALKRIAGSKEISFAGTRKLAQWTGMSVGMICNSKKILEKTIVRGKPLIRIESRDGKVDTITLVDIWFENTLEIEKTSEDHRSPHERTVHPMNGDRSPHERKKIVLKNIHKEDKRERKEADASSAADKKDEEQQKFVALWNKYAPRKITFFSEKRRKAFKQRLGEDYFVESYPKALLKLKESDFLQGYNDRKWVASPEWFLRPDSVPKIMEGAYDNRAESRSNI